MKTVLGIKKKTDFIDNLFDNILTIQAVNGSLVFNNIPLIKEIYNSMHVISYFQKLLDNVDDKDLDKIKDYLNYIMVSYIESKIIGSRTITVNDIAFDKYADYYLKDSLHLILSITQPQFNVYVAAITILNIFSSARNNISIYSDNEEIISNLKVSIIKSNVDLIGIYKELLSKSKKLDEKTMLAIKQRLIVAYTTYIDLREQDVDNKLNKKYGRLDDELSFRKYIYKVHKLNVYKDKIIKDKIVDTVVDVITSSLSILDYRKYRFKPTE